MQRKGWFDLPGRPGDRTLEEQMNGLGAVFRYAQDRTVLDVGCAEGLISRAIYLAGAKSVLGIEIVPSHVDVAKQLTTDMLGVQFLQADANSYEPTSDYDVMLMLAILHKLRNPSQVAQRFARRCNCLCVVRLPPEAAPVIVDARSGYVPHDIQAAMAEVDFYLDGVTTGHFNEWVGYFWRVPGSKPLTHCE